MKDKDARVIPFNKQTSGPMNPILKGIMQNRYIANQCPGCGATSACGGGCPIWGRNESGWKK